MPQTLPTRISLVIQDLYLGGAQYVTAQVANGLVQRGYLVDLVVSRVHSRYMQERPDLKPFALHPGVRNVVLPHVKASRNVLALRNYFRTSRPAVVFIMQSTYLPPVILASRLCRARPRVVVVDHSVVRPHAHLDYNADDKKTGRPPWLPSGFLAQFVRNTASWWSYRLADRCAGVGQGATDAIAVVYKVPRDRLITLCNPVVDGLFHEKLAQSPAHDWLSNKTKPVIVAAGAHTWVKRFDILLRSFSEVRKRQSCRLIVFGEGPETQRLRDQARMLNVSEDVDFPGFTSNLPAHIRQADVFVVSSRFESFSVVLVEALAAGTPVVATASADYPSGPREILDGGRHGLLVPPEDAAALAGAIQRVLEGDGIKPTPESWAPYTIDRVLDGYLACIHGLLVK